MSPTPPMPIAVVGIGCRFPGGVTDPTGFWRLLAEGVDAIGEIPADRIDLGHYFDPRPATPGRMMTRWGGFLDGIDRFDAGFFGISPREAERLDPQQRLLLETAWEALEDAGLDARGLEGSRTGVFVGQWLSDFEARLFADPEGVDFFMTTGSGRYASSGRLSYLLGLRGPSLTLDTACSSSLAAVHLAARSVRSGESEIAIAGGVNIILQPHISVAYSQSRMMAPDGRCKFGDARGDGYVRSEGAGLVVLKPLDKALADGDRVYAVIRGSALNNDGRASGSMGTPSQAGQEALLRSACEDAGIDPAQVGYVEAHGTGTRAGDPVELGAIAAVLGAGRDPAQPVRVGSVKTNIGHTEGAAGVAGLIKAALALHHGRIPQSLHCQQPNPAIPWADIPVVVAREATPWPRGAQPRLAGVSAFGIAGTNAHVLLQEAPAASATPAPRVAPAGEAALLVLSARDEGALRAQARRFADVLSAGAPLADLCWNAATRRTPHEHRAAFVAGDAAAMAEALRQHGDGQAAAAEGRAPEAHPRIAFICPGQGAQWDGMARELMAREPVFKAALERCDAAARPYVDWSIVEQLALEPGDPKHLLERIDVIQPVLVAIALAYAELWRSLGVRPDAVVGHSMGEVAAACIAGALSLDEAMRIICRRSALMRRTSGQGAMALVDLPMDEAQRRLAGHEHEVSVAVSNSPRSSVISGRPEAVQALMAAWAAQNVFCRLVKVDVASHSPQMQPLAEELRAELAGLSPGALAVPLISTVLARRAEAHELGAAYWGDNLRQPVRFGAAVQRLLDEGVTVFIELGPHPVLLPSVEQTAQAAGAEVAVIGCARRGEPEQAAWLAAVGAAFCAGVAPDWSRLMPEGGRFLTLPTYPWQRERHWIAAAERAAAGAQGHGRTVPSQHPVLGAGIELAGTPVGALWSLSIDPQRVPAWFGHALHGSALLPASAYLELALAAARALSPEQPLVLEGLSFERALHLQADAACALQLQASADGQGGLRLAFQTHSGSEWLPHARARLAAPAASGASPASPVDTAALQRGAALSADAVYQRLSALGAGFAAPLRGIGCAWLSADEALVQLQALPDAAVPGFCFAPEVLDACFQAAALLAPEGQLCLPTGLEQVRAHRAPTGPSGAVGAPGALSLHLRRRAGAGLIDATLLDEQGPVLALRGLRLQPLGERSMASPSEAFYDLRWQPAEPAPAAAPPGARRWCLIADRGGLGPELLKALREAGETAELLHDALPTAEAMAGATTEVVDLRALDLSAIDGTLAAALHRLLLTAQALERLPPASRTRLWWVTRGAMAVSPAEATALALAQSPLSGLAAVMATEQGERWGGLIDLDPAATPGDAALALAQALPGAAPGTLALRGAQGFEPRLRRAPWAPEAPPRWRPDASYLITGGLGGIGQPIAQRLVAQGARHLVVLSRTPLPARAAWAGLGADTPAGRAVAAVRGLESLGASVRHVALDVADEAALRDWLEGFAAEAHPPIRGVFHAAGLTDDQLVRDLDAASLAAVLRPKLGGAWNLHRLLPELDAFVLFSSMAALMPQAGQASYAAANAFLDGLARYRRALGQPALSIGWGVWSQTGVMRGETGQRQQDELQRQGIGAFAPAQALALFDEALRWPHGHLLAMPIDWARLRAQGGARQAPLLRDLFASEAAPAQQGAASAAPAPAEPADPAERRRALELTVREVVGRVLKLNPARIDPRKPLGSLGLTSLMALELRNRLEPLHGQPLSATLAWNYPTIEALTGFLAGAHATAPVPSAAPVAAPDAGPAPDIATVLDGVNQLSDEDAALLLRRRR
ncbi:SDR family NAD(P)-dependent oxidoreductase [Hydrogenophaga sp. YM1]|uniref:type I polyketide synthase n=1 Tax=Hydrogenophaga sp. YM1 TaxID=2806262 RepID=UPI00195DCDB3|nr:type I polyketide synthase [Hydrogenophaga sp. YM1]QRR36010.1 SDR family NAD(P)-dependent oxidoreductase [Hydrogenophaga sp. YM1]